MDTLEFSRRVPVLSALKARGSLRFEANETECRAIAQRAELPSVSKFLVEGAFATDPSGGFRFEGRVAAAFTQVCSRSGKEFPSSIEEPVKTIFFFPDVAKKLDEEELEEIEDFEILEGEEADIGELGVQYFLLSLDPFPILRGDIPKKGVTSGIPVLSEEEHRKEKSPFAVLEKLQKKT